MLSNEVSEIAREAHKRIIDIRRHLHMHPELSFQEEQTGKFIQETLKDIGVSFTRGWAGHGVVGMIEGNKPERAVVALRADMDALPIVEDNDVEYKSRNRGVMHACGHDVHTASLLGAAIILQRLRSKFDGTVKLIFQPAEEKTPGGASIMIKDGVLKNPKPASIVGQHVYPQLPAGQVGFRAGRFMASSDEFLFRVIGRGGHGALPQLTVDPIAIAAQIITGLQQVVSRMSDPTMPSVLTLGKIESDGGWFNIIPNSVQIRGTFRTFDEEWRVEGRKKIKHIAEGIARSYGAKCEVEVQVGYPVLLNDPGLTTRCRDAAIELLGAENVKEVPLRLTSEDFSYYTHHTAGCFYRLGVGNEEKGITSSVHTSTFDIDEEALQVGAAMLSWLALSELNHRTH